MPLLCRLRLHSWVLRSLWQREGHVLSEIFACERCAALKVVVR